MATTGTSDALGRRGRKKGGGRAPREAANTLRSQQTADVVLLVSEGEAEGLVNGLRSVYLDRVPVQNADGSRNFEGVDFAYNVGTQGQPALPGIAAVQAETAVGVQVDQAAPVVRTIADAEVDHVRVTIAVPQLIEQNPSTGDLNGSEFEWAIEVQAAGAGYVEKFRETVKGKTTAAYQKSVRIPLTGASPWDVRVRRISADPATSNVTNRFSWSSYTSIKSVKLRYPNSAVAMLRVPAQVFPQVPEVAFDWLGQRVQVPANYDPIARTYSGTWNGTFKIAWTNSAPWVLYDLVTHERYGLGQFVPAALANKWQLYAIGQYSDQLVPDGRGGMEPRFTFNAEITTRHEALELLQQVAAVFRGMVFWASNAIEFAQDAPADATLLYTPANVVDGLFDYADTSERTKHSMFVCWWNDQSQFGEPVPEVYVDEALVARYGLREVELKPMGLTSRGMAARVCRWARHSEQLEGETVTFTVGSDGVAARPGQVFRVADPNEAGERLGGRIRAATASTVTLDEPMTLRAGESYTLSVLKPDPARPVGLLTETRAVTSPAGTHETLTVSPPFGSTPEPQTVWLLESNAVAATTWRCLDVEELDGGRRYRITGVAHNPSKYAAIEQGLVLDTRPISRLTLRPPKPASVALSENVFQAGQIYRASVIVSWPEPAPGLLYVVSWRLNGAGWTMEPETGSNSVELPQLPAGTLEVEVRAKNVLGNLSPAEAAQLVLQGAGQLTGMWRAVARGYSDMAGPAASGLYDSTGALVAGAERSYTLDVFDRTDGRRLSSTSYDVYAGTAAADALAAALNALGTDRAVCVRSHDEPRTNRLHPALAEAMYRCGASRAVYGSPNFFGRGSYILVGIPGCGEGRGQEVYNGDIEDAANAWSELSFMLTVDGRLIVTGGSTPRTLADYGYTGDMAATSDIALVSAANCTIAGNTVRKTGGAFGAWDATAYSRERFAGPCIASFQLHSTTDTWVMLALNRDPGAVGFAQLDHAIYYSSDSGGQLWAYESGVGVNLEQVCAVGDIFSIEHDGARQVWRRNGVALRTVASGPNTGAPYACEVSLFRLGSEARNVTFRSTASLAVAGSTLADSNGRITSDSRLLGNLVDASRWVLGSSGSQPGFTANGGAAENWIEMLDGPDGSHRPVWVSVAGAGGAGAGADDGGWDGEQFRIDHTKQYLFAVAIRPKVVGGGSYYLGPGGATVNDIGGGVNANPYFHARGRGELVLGRWYLLTGYVMPSGYAGAQLNLGGVYDGVTGERIAAGTDYRWVNGQQVSWHRTYQYYTPAGARQEFVEPGVWVCDGTEPKLKDLLATMGTRQLAEESATEVMRFEHAGPLGLGGQDINPAIAFTAPDVPSRLFATITFQYRLTGNTGGGSYHAQLALSPFDLLFSNGPDTQIAYASPGQVVWGRVTLTMRRDLAANAGAVAVWLMQGDSGFEGNNAYADLFNVTLGVELVKR